MENTVPGRKADRAQLCELSLPLRHLCHSGGGRNPETRAAGEPFRVDYLRDVAASSVAR